MILRCLYLVDPSTQSLNPFTENLANAEALSALVASILEGNDGSRNSLITYVQPPAVSPRPSSRYDREVLYEQVWNAPVKELAKEYGISESGIYNACRRLQIPVPGLGYRAKKAANRPVPPRPPLLKVQAHGKAKRVTATKP